MKASLCGAVALAVLISAAPAADFQTGMVAYQRGDFLTALSQWQDLAQQGDEIAQYNLGVMYAKGQGVHQDVRKAASWYGKAAEKGVAGAQFAVGELYRKGEVFPQNSRKAFEWFMAAARQGNKRAQNNVGFMYHSGDGVNKDDVLAYVWLDLAASQGYQKSKLSRKRIANRMRGHRLERAKKLSRVFYDKYVSPFQQGSVAKR